jgi:uncharacterized protein
MTGALADRERYVSLTTFRRDGTPVRTAVWFATLRDGRLAIVTDADSGKRKRLRNDPRCTVAACDVRGRVHGVEIGARAAVVEDPEAMREGLAALAARYGMQWRAFNLSRRVRRRPDHQDRVILLVTLD